MTHEERPDTDESGSVLGRREMLKSAGALLAASTAGLSTAVAQEDSSAEESGRGEWHQVIPPPLHKGMISFTLSHEQFTVPELARLGPLAEAAGFDVLATSDHFQPWQDNQHHAGLAWVTLAAIGARTRQTWMGTTVTCPILRYNPAVVAEAFASLSLLHPGRIYLGLGSGEALNEEAATGQWPAWQERWERLIEAVTIIRELWTGKPVDFKGTYYTVKARLYDPPAKPIPLLLAANGPKAMRLAGQHGDGLVTDPMTWMQYKGEWEAGAATAGKNTAEMPVLVEQYVVVGTQADAQQAARLWNFEPKAFKGYQNIPSPVTIEEEAEAQIPLQKVYAPWVVSTDPNEHVEKIKQLFASGVWIANIHSGQPRQRAVISFYGKEVLPRFK